jgi:hypothetical protein
VFLLNQNETTAATKNGVYVKKFRWFTSVHSKTKKSK